MIGFSFDAFEHLRSPMKIYYDIYTGEMQVSYMILQRVSPVTHSVGNCVKRVVVIVSSVLFFKTSVSSINALGKLILFEI